MYELGLHIRGRYSIPASLGHNDPGTLYTASGFLGLADPDPCCPGTLDRGCGYFKWMDSPSGSSTPPSSFPRSSTPPSYSPGTSTRPSFSPGSSRSAQNLGKAECSNCKFLAEKIKTLEARIRILEGQLEMERHPENHTLESAAILHEIYNGMGNLNME
ncbi:hypothetical protein Tco_1284464 [Tanacetum coccineum]